MCLNSGKNSKRWENEHCERPCRVVLPWIGWWFLQNLRKRRVSSGLQRLGRWLMAVRKCSVYHSRKRAPFSDSCVSSGRSQAMLCMLSTWDHAGPIAVCGHGGYCCFRLLLLHVAAFKVFRSDDFRWIYTRDVPYYQVWYWDRLWVRYLWSFLVDTCASTGFCCVQDFTNMQYNTYRCFCKLTRNNERSCQDEEIAA